jgi:hypothetical protein
LDAGFRSAMRELYRKSHFADFMACHAWRPDAPCRNSMPTTSPLPTWPIVTDPGWWAIVGQAALVVAFIGRSSAAWLHIVSRVKKSALLPSLA